MMSEDVPHIPEGELTYRTARSSGPGGQHVNKTDTRVILLFDVDASPSLSEQQKRLVRERLAGRISREGILRLSSQRFRSQYRNRLAVREKFDRLLTEALSPEAERIPTRLPAREKVARLRRKQLRGRLKKTRGKERAPPDLDGDGS